MKIFHIFAVYPIDVAGHELPAVQHHDYYIASTSLAAAFAEIKEFAVVVGASEVWGAQKNEAVIIHAATRLNTRIDLGQHQHWANVQKRYKLLANGAESPEEFVRRRFAENCPQFA